MSLRKYRKKRDFKRSAEPYGSIKKNKQLIYIIQKHAASHLHYDLRLELNGVLKSWAIPKGPSLDNSIKRLAVHVEDHPLEYAKFEGIIPKGEYGGGTVMLWDTGTWVCETADANSAYKKGHLSFILKGKKLKGAWNLVQIKNNPKNWLFIKVKDKFARSEKQYDVTQAKPNSVISRCSLQGIAKKFQADISDKPKIIKTSKNTSPSKARKKPMPNSMQPELATLVEKPPTGDEWLHEIKFDGYRLFCFIKDKKIKFLTRNQKDWTEKFKELQLEVQKLNLKSAILDGEVIAVDKKHRSDFQLLSNSINTKEKSILLYAIFDLIYYQGKDLRLCALQDRKNLLRKLIPLNNNKLIFSSDIEGNNGNIFLKKACKKGLEGIVSKNKLSPYVSGRNRNWLKIKCNKRQEFLVVGFTPGKGNRHYFASLVLAVHGKSHQLLYCGKVGTGFNESSLKNINKLLNKYKTSKAPFKEIPAAIGEVSWITPKIIVEVEFTEWTRAGVLRHPSFKGLRNDKRLEEITKE
ncbi:non-homologous end-joining DNA ligase [Rickettsiella endosymbiont of Miltochrista miniata]|uniref:non-homologous end-joining DNA ligase n=1 Tax=Rickettsiella endosymbiont of Miltochrista miniata TaxID=3066239 RepID=UPI00313D6CBE